MPAPTRLAFRYTIEYDRPVSEITQSRYLLGGAVRREGMIKLLMTWDIKPECEQEYMEFIMRDFGPAMVEAGLHPTDAWYTMYGEGPKVLAGGVTDTLQRMHEILSSKEWQELEGRLITLVNNYERRIMEATGGFQF